MIETRSLKGIAKVERMNAALRHREPDRVPIGEFYWGSFLERWRRELCLAVDTDPYAHYDLDWIVTMPNMDPHIRSFDVLSETPEEVVVRTGFEAVVRKRFDMPMPKCVSWDTDTLEKLEAFEFDAPNDPRRFHEAGDNHVAGVGDGYTRNSPPWHDTVLALRDDFAVYGSIIESSELLTRLIGQMNTLFWIGEHSERFGEQVLRAGEFCLRCCEAQLDAGAGLLDGMVIWGDVAFARNMFFPPEYWRAWYRPTVAAMIDLCHARGLQVIYHGCGNVKAILPDFIEMGLDAYNPLEAKAGLDVVDLRREYGHSMAFCGNSDVQVWEAGDEKAVRREVLRKLNAAKGGGYLFQSDHSASSGVSGKTYDNIIRFVREFGQYPLELGEYDEEI